MSAFDPRRLDDAFLDRFEDRFGPVAKALGRLIRPAIIARPGKTLVWSDWSAIEARVLPWLADSRGADKVLDIFRANDKDPSAPDIYKIEAGNIFGKDPRDVDKGPERQTGKVAVLSLGFGGAEGALMAMATNYGIYLPPDEQTRIVRAWRENNRWAKNFWGAHGRDGSYGLWGAVNSAMENPDTIFPAGRVAYVFDKTYLGGTLFCALPCGRLLSYPGIKWEKREVTDKKTGKVEDRVQLTFVRDYSRSALWYGKCAENITQATAGSILRGKMRHIEIETDLSDWMPLVGHTHDELVSEVDEDRAEEAEATLLKLMVANDPWNEGLPLAAETTVNWWYSKSPLPATKTKAA